MIAATADWLAMSCARGRWRVIWRLKEKARRGSRMSGRRDCETWKKQWHRPSAPKQRRNARNSRPIAPGRMRNVRRRKPSAPKSKPSAPEAKLSGRHAALRKNVPSVSRLPVKLKLQERDQSPIARWQRRLLNKRRTPSESVIPLSKSSMFHFLKSSIQNGERVDLL